MKEMTSEGAVLRENNTDSCIWSLNFFSPDQTKGQIQNNAGLKIKILYTCGMKSYPVSTTHLSTHFLMTRDLH